LGIRDAVVEGERGVLKGGELVGEEGRDEGITADGLTEGAGAGGKFSGRAKDSEGLLEGEGISRGQDGRGAGNRGKEFCLGEAEFNAMGSTKAFEFL
jgi:hypothetical protein